MNRAKILVVLIAILCPLRTVFGDPRTTTIGVIAPLTGQMATFGAALRNGFELAQQDYPELFRGIQFRYQDDQFDPKLSLTGYHSLSRDNQLDLIFVFDAVPGEIVAHQAERDGIDTIIFSFATQPARGRSNVMRAMNPASEYMESLARYLDTQKYSDLLVVRTEGVFFREMVEGLHSAVGQRQRITDYGAFDAQDHDFHTVIMRMKLLQAPGKRLAIGLFLTPAQLLAFQRQARALNFNGEFFGTDLFDTAALIAKGRVDFTGAAYPDNVTNLEFRQRYLARFSDGRQLTFAASAYEVARLMAERIGRGDGKRIISNNLLRDVVGRPSVMGELSYIDDPVLGKYLRFPVQVKRIE